MTPRRIKAAALDAVILILGSALVAAGLSMFTAPNDIAPGGVSGLATALAYLVGDRISIGLWTFLLHVPLVIVAWRKLGFRPLARTAVATVLLSLFIDLFTAVLPHYTNNILLAACFGGALCGAGMGLLFVRGASTGGTDLLSLLLNRAFPNLSVSRLLLFVDAGVVVFAVCVFRNIEVALYSFVTIFVTTKIIDSIMQGVDYAKVIYIVTESGEDMRKTLTAETECGVTVLSARGGFTGREKQLLMVITRRSEFAQTLGLVKSIDKTAFIFVTNATEVHGEGFKPIE